MSQSDWRDKLTVGVTLLLLITLISVVSASTLDRHRPENASGEHNLTVASASDEIGQEVKPTWNWDGLVSTRDTLANWIMALLSVAAVLLSGVAVYFVWRTLQKTAEANIAATQAAIAASETNAIMRDERRPWLEFEIEHFHLRHARRSDGKISPCFAPELKIKNWGKSPAFLVNFDARAVLGDRFSIHQVSEFIKFRTSGKLLTMPYVVFPGAEVTRKQFSSSMYDNLWLSIDGSDTDSKSAQVMAILLYFHDGEWRCTSKVYTCKANDLLPRPTIGHFEPLQMTPLDRYT